jgi:antitoxin component of MazEF toxin-antitoxin module
MDLEKTNFAVNIRKRGGSLVIRVPPEIIQRLRIKEDDLCRLLINEEERVVCFKFLKE